MISPKCQLALKTILSSALWCSLLMAQPAQKPLTNEGVIKMLPRAITTSLRKLRFCQGEYAVVLRPVAKDQKFSGGDVERGQGPGLMFNTQSGYFRWQKTRSEAQVRVRSERNAHPRWFSEQRI